MMLMQRRKVLLPDPMDPRMVMRLPVRAFPEPPFREAGQSLYLLPAFKNAFYGGLKVTTHGLFGGDIVSPDHRM